MVLNKVGKSEKVELKTLDRYCLDKNISVIDFLKIDVEGNELNVLKGGEKVFKEGIVKRIQFEYGGANIDSRVFLKDILYFLWGYNFYVYKIFPDRLQVVTEYDQRLDNFQYQNWFATKSEVTG